MALTPSTMMPLGTVAPDFQLPDAGNDKIWTRDTLNSGKGLLVMFICAHCPYVKHLERELGAFGNETLDKGLGVVAICSNDIENYPEDRPEKLVEQARNNDFKFPYLFDETQEVAKAYDAACTPDFFLFDANQQCVYRGRFDSSTPGNGEPVTGSDLHRAVSALLDREDPVEDQTPSMGCNIKWK